MIPTQFISAMRLLIRIRVRRSEIFTRISDLLPDLTADASRRSLSRLATNTNRNTAPSSLTAPTSTFIFSSPIDRQPRALGHGKLVHRPVTAWA